MPSTRKRVDQLKVADLRRHALWQFCNDDSDDLLVEPVRRRRVASLDGRLIGLEVTFADGSNHWAILGNVDLRSAPKTQHLLTVGVFDARAAIFSLARYFDSDWKRSGPEALARLMRRRIEQVFPVRYDLRPFVLRPADWLQGEIQAKPKRRLSKEQLIAMAVP